jgi:hypothetical protein
MFISVHKRSAARPQLQLSAMATGTTSDVWSEEEEFSKIARRQVRVDIVREEARHNRAAAN